MPNAKRSIFLAALVCVAAAAPLRAQVWRDSLAVQLRRELVPTRLSGDLMRVVTPGILMVFQKDGVPGRPGIQGLGTATHYHDGTIEQPHGLSASLTGSSNTREWKTGDKVYINRIDLGREGRTVWLALASNELTPLTVDGNSTTARYSASLVIDFPEGVLATATPAQVISAISGILKTESAASTPATVALGQTAEQVEQALGKPQTVINLGARVIYVYAGMRVVFQDGKVADVQ